MSAPQTTRIVRLVGSCGIRIPTRMLEQAGIYGSVEIEISDCELVIRAVQHHRAGWREMCQHIVEDGDDELLDGDSIPLTEWQANEWEW